MSERMKQMYKLGFISEQEFINYYIEELSQYGAERNLCELVNKSLQPLANYLLGIMEGSNKNIEDFKIGE